jgi:hypothetical protein
MKKDKSELGGELCSEYDLKNLRVRKLGVGRKSFGGVVVRLESDVAEMFPSADAVNEALRFLVRVTQKNQSSGPEQQHGKASEMGEASSD